MARFAEGTTVTVESSRGEISGILTKHGVKRQGWVTEPEADTLHFELEGRVYRFRIEHPTWEDIKANYAYASSPDQRLARVQAEWRRRWRANVLLLKAKLEFADGEASTVIRELMPYAVLTDGRTLEEAIVAGDQSVPLLEAKTR